MHLKAALDALLILKLPGHCAITAPHRFINCLTQEPEKKGKVAKGRPAAAKKAKK